MLPTTVHCAASVRIPLELPLAELPLIIARVPGRAATMDPPLAAVLVWPWRWLFSTRQSLPSIRMPVTLFELRLQPWTVVLPPALIPVWLANTVHDSTRPPKPDMSMPTPGFWATLHPRMVLEVARMPPTLNVAVQF